jgi:predicted phosphodiesterase
MRTLALSLLSLLAPTLAHAADVTRIAVISDVHVDVHARVSPNFTRLVTNLIQRHPKLVIFTGDATCGNESDTYPLARIRTWWQAFARAVAPLQAAGIPVLPVAGNHDYYLVAHQQAYVEGARAILAANPGQLELDGQVPLFYSLDIDRAHLILLHVVDQKLEPAVRKWLAPDLGRKHGGKLLFAFGHVPLHSNMGHTDRDFEEDLGGILAAAGVSAYVAGHEHLYWDENLALSPRALRQVTVGTASAMRSAMSSSASTEAVDSRPNRWHWIRAGKSPR